MTIAAMRLQLSQTIGLRAKLETIFDLLIEILRSVRDFSVFHGITFGEILFFLYVFGRTLWYLVVGVESTFNYYFSETTWMLIFVACSVVHLVAFFFKGTKFRAIVILFYAVIWTFLALLAAIAQVRTPAVPSYCVFALGSIYIAVRLWTDKKN